MTDNESLLQFPCEFPIKIVGKNSANFSEEIMAIVRKHFPEIPDSGFVCNPSQKGNYLAITATVYVHSQEELDALYRELTQHPDIKMVL
jgi:putative lipoic acid-binding regulatory protein